MKKIALIVCVCMLSMTLFGCGNKKELKTSNGEEHYTISINVMNAEKKMMASYDYLCEKFNVDFDLIPCTSGDWLEKVRIWMATGDMPDVLWVDIQDYNFSEYLSWVSQGLVKELPDMSKYPNLYKAKQSLESDSYFQVDGKSYAWVGPNVFEKTNFCSPLSFMYRRDWAEKLGIAKDEYTWDEFVDVAKQFVEKDPGGNGKGNTIGISGIAGAFPHFVGLMQSSPYWETYYKKGDKYVWGMGEPETLEGIKIAKQLYDEGILWQDQIIAKGNDGVNKFMSGQSGIVFSSWKPSTIHVTRDNMKKMFPDLNVEEDVVPMFVKAPNGEMWGQKSKDYWSVCVFNPNLSDEKLDRILQIFDWGCSEEGIEMAKLGLEGEDYVIENGKTVQFNPTDSINPILSNGIIRTNNDFPFEDETISESARKTTLLITDRLQQDDANLKTTDYDVYFFNGENKNKYGSFYEEGKEKIKEIIMSSDDVEKDWNEWKASVQPKVNLVLKELNESLLK